METKTCTKCGEVKLRELFETRRTSKDGLKSHCKACRAEYRKSNAEKERAQQAEWRKSNADKKHAADAEWRKKNAEKLRAAKAEYHKKNAEKLRAAKAEHYKKNAEEMRAKSARHAESLSPSYVAHSLKIPTADLTPELLAMKREQLETRRLARQVKQLLKDYENDQGIRNSAGIARPDGSGDDHRGSAPDCSERYAGADAQGDQRD